MTCACLCYWIFGFELTLLTLDLKFLPVLLCFVNSQNDHGPIFGVTLFTYKIVNIVVILFYWWFWWCFKIVLFHIILIILCCMLICLSRFPGKLASNSHC